MKKPSPHRSTALSHLLRGDSAKAISMATGINHASAAKLIHRMGWARMYVTPAERAELLKRRQANRAAYALGAF